MRAIALLLVLLTPTLAAEKQSLADLVDELAERGLDVEPLAATVDDMEDTLRQSRSLIHAFDRSEFEDLEKHGHDAVRQGWELVDAAEGEYRVRLTGLRVAIGFMILLSVALYLKIREMESRA